MLSQETIKKLAQNHQTTELNIRREYLQHLFLSYFYEQPKAREIYFKGGTALRVIYQSPRFSEDLDFTSSIKKISEIERLIVKTLAEIERFGFEINIEEAKQTSGGYLANIYFDAKEYKTTIQIQISLRESGKRGEAVMIVNAFVPAYTLVQLSQKQLVEEKISALLDRGKPRDFYDLYFILRANLLSANKRSVLPKALLALKKTSFSFSKELKQFLPKKHWPVIRNFSASLEREIERFC